MISTSVVLTVAAKKGIETIVENYVVPKLSESYANVVLDMKDTFIPHREHFKEYFERTYNKFSILNSLALHNSQLKLKDVYLPLTIVEENKNGKDAVHVVTGYPKELMDKSGKILITDTAGMGKSTMTKRIFLDIIENGYGIPIFIELRRLSRKNSMLQEIVAQLDSLNKNFDRDLLFRFIENGEFVFILDGYDEISFGDKEAVTSDIQDFVSRASTGNHFIMSSRPEGALTCFGDFVSLRIQPLEKEEAYTLIKNYDPEGEVSRLLLEQLQSGKYNAIDEFLKNPLLVSLLYKAFDFKPTIPLKKHIFYRQVYDAYYESHDLSKGDGYVHEKKTNLPTDEFNRILRSMGFLCLMESKVEFDKDEVLKLINNAKKLCPNIEFRASDFLSDVLKTVPLFVQDGNYFKWSHKSLQEYFAAMFIYLDTKEQQGAILQRMYQSSHRDSYYNLLDLYFDIDQDGFRQYILLDFLRDYLDYRERKWPNLKEIEIESSLIEQRLFSLYCTKMALYKSPELFQNDKDIHRCVNRVIALLSKRSDLNDFRQMYHDINNERNLELVVLGGDSIASFVKIICNHMSELFIHISIKDIYARSEEAVAMPDIPIDELYPIDVLTEIQNVKGYAVINKYAIRQCFYVYPNIEKFKKETAAIQKQIKSRFGKDLFDAL